MKVVMVGPVYPFRGGIAHYTTMLAQSLGTGGHTVQVVSFSRQYPAFLYPGTTDRDPSQKPIDFSPGFSTRYLLDPLYPWTWEKAARVILAEHPDLVIFQWWITFWSPAFSYLAYRLRKKGTRILFAVHNVIPHEARVWDRFLVHMALSQTNDFITLSRKETGRLKEMFPSAHVIESALPIYNDLAQQKIPAVPAREQLGLPLENPLILFFGLVRPYKGLPYLIEALSMLNQQGGCPTVHLVIAGEFWEDVKKYEQQIERLGLGEQVHIHNHYISNEELPLFFSAADFLVVPYLDATQSGVIQMGLSFGVPIIGTEAAIGDISRAGFPCTLVPSRSPEALADALVQQIGKPAQPLDIETVSRKLWSDLFTALAAMTAGR